MIQECGFEVTGEGFVEFDEGGAELWYVKRFTDVGLQLCCAAPGETRQGPRRIDEVSRMSWPLPNSRYDAPAPLLQPSPH
jgi:hypothetical protein